MKRIVSICRPLEPCPGRSAGDGTLGRGRSSEADRGWWPLTAAPPGRSTSSSLALPDAMKDEMRRMGFIAFR